MLLPLRRLGVVVANVVETPVKPFCTLITFHGIFASEGLAMRNTMHTEHVITCTFSYTLDAATMRTSHGAGAVRGHATDFIDGNVSLLEELLDCVSETNASGLVDLTQ